MWIILSLIYAVTNAIYINYNNQRHYNGYLLGIWRGFGVSIFSAPLLLSISLNLSPAYLVILIIQGLLVGIYDSRIFFASARFGGNVGNGFMSTAVLLTTFLWWTLEFADLQKLLLTPQKFLTIVIILSAYSISYWIMMRTKINQQAEQYLYPAVFALAMMSIATRYIALNGSDTYTGIVSYLTIACFISGIYNSVMYLLYKKTNTNTASPSIKEGLWLITFSTVLIAAKTAAMRLCENPGYVVSLLLLSPIIAAIIHRHRLIITQALVINLVFLILLLLTVG